MKFRNFPTWSALWGALFFGYAAQSKPQSPVLVFKQDSNQLNEVSGVAIVRTQPKLWWMHNDSGDSPRLFAVNRDGKIALTVNLQGAQAFDWEDMDAQGDYVYTGDIGDNLSLRSDIQIYRFKSPRIKAKAQKTELNLSPNQWGKTTLRFPDGPHNCESLAATPDGRLLLVTKEENGISAFFTLNSPWKNGARATLSKIGSYKFGGAEQFSRLATGADFSPDGRKLVITTYTALYEFPLDQRFAFNSLQFSPVTQDLPAQKQCEAVCYSLDGKTIYSTGEKEGAPVWKLGSKLK